jgi:predicted amidohydrolase
MPQGDEDAMNLRVGIVQPSPAFGEVEKNISMTLDLMSPHAADLWVLPELFASGYQFRSAGEARELAEPVPDGVTTQALAAYARKKNCFLIAGLPELAGECVYNAAVLVGPDGFVARYRKIHLFYEEVLHFAPGDLPFEVVDLGIAKVGMMICFDHLFPESARSLALQGAEIIAHPANLVLPDLAQRTMSVRALENGVFTITANRVGTEARTSESLTYTGQSQIVDPKGSPVICLSKTRVEAAVVDVDIAAAADKAITKHNHKLNDRRPHLYRL